MPCGESLRLQLYFDGELDAAESARVARHLSECPQCRALTHEWEFLKGSLRQISSFETPTALRARIADAWDAEDAADGFEPMPALPPARLVTAGTGGRARWVGAFWKGAISGVVGSALAAMLAYLLLIPRSDALVDVLANAHRQSLLPNRLVAVVSSDHHTVKPWFAGRADVSPVVADYAADGFRLVGGRVDAVQGHRAAVIVYAHGAHLINVFSWPKGPGFVPRDTIRFGYHLAFWHSGDLEYCAISDTNWSELHTLEELVRRSSDHDFIEEGTSGD